MGKLINRIPGSRLLISSLPGSASRTHVESLGKPRDVNAFSKPCLVNLISKDTHLVFSIYIYLCSGYRTFSLNRSLKYRARGKAMFLRLKPHTL